MAPPDARTEADVVREIEAGRARLESSLEELRASVAAATDLRARLGPRLPAAAAAAAGAGFLLAGGISATVRLLTGRGDDERRGGRG